MEDPTPPLLKAQPSTRGIPSLARARAKLAGSLKALNAVDTYCFEQQTGKQPSGAPPAEVKAQLEAAVSSLDSVITQAVAARELLGS